MSEAPMATGSHWFWGGLVVLNVVWYCTVTVYVAIRGVLDIRRMLARLASRHQQEREQA
ncbi:MAG: hypothetical protein AB1505_21140 [Candidatus Latescibacterota bacterium]